MRVSSAAALVLALDLGVNAFSFVPAVQHGSRSVLQLGAEGIASQRPALPKGFERGAMRLRSQHGIPKNRSENESSIRVPKSLATDRGRPLVVPEFVEEHNQHAVKFISDFVKIVSPGKGRKVMLEVEGDPEEIFAKLREVGLADKTVMHFQDAEKPPLEIVESKKEEMEDDKTHPSYFKTPIRDLIFRRSGVLVALLLLQSVSSVVLSNYQGLIEQNVFLALFLTMLTGTGGNAGNQSSALVIRGLSTGEIHKENMWLVIIRELMASSAIGMVLAGAAFARVLLTQGCNVTAALIISLTTYVVVVVAIGGGTAVPLILDRMGVDPVHLSSPILATLTDVMGVLLLCVITTVAMGHM